MAEHGADATHFDVVIIGAGLSGIGAACHLRMKCPDKSYVILESRDAIGGTWDLFRYPGVRSDSDMFTLGYSFRPWREARAIADGASILEYVRQTATAYGVDRRIRFGQRCLRAAWSSADATWTIETACVQKDGGEARPGRITCNFLFSCSGYYNYANGYMPEFPGIERFAGAVVHPQSWPQDLDHAGKRVVVIGSGATAVTLVPALAAAAAHVTMLQRSPTYVVSRPSQDALANRLRRRLPAGLAYRLIRWRNVLLGIYFYRLARRKPDLTRGRILALIRGELGAEYDIGTHFTPRYNPWDQRLCLVPDGDLFRAIAAGDAEIVTDRIERFIETGIRLDSGRELQADLVVAATGLQLQFMGGMQLSVDGVAVDLPGTTTYKGMMYSDVPNLATAFGYTNASWTLKADLTSEYVCRLLNHMSRRRYTSCTPRLRDASVTQMPVLDFTSGYIQRSIASFPRQGSSKPWRVYQNYVLDLLSMRYGRVRDGVMEFARIQTDPQQSTRSARVRRRRVRVDA